MEKVIIGLSALFLITTSYSMDNTPLLADSEKAQELDRKAEWPRPEEKLRDSTNAPLLLATSKEERAQDPRTKWSSLLSRPEEELLGTHIVYHPGYNVTFFGLEKKHPFDSTKYQQIKRYLDARHPDLRFHRPAGPVPDEVLATVHTSEYLNKLRLTKFFDLLNTNKIRESRELLAQISEMNDLKDQKTTVMLLMLYSKLLKPMRLAVQGTIDATLLAIKNGWSVNLGGGFHHARAEMGSGYCFYADVPIAIQLLLRAIRPTWTILIVDLDVHHGDGNEAICGSDPKVFILDMFNKNIFAADRKPDKAKRVNYMAAIEPGILDGEWLNTLNGDKHGAIGDDKYLEQLNALYTKALEECKPDFIFYNAGTDVYREDPLGRMNITQDGIIRRDALVFEKALERGIPICMVPSGGYAKKDFPQIADNYYSHVIKTSSSEIICSSLSNLLENVIPKYSKPRDQRSEDEPT